MPLWEGNILKANYIKLQTATELHASKDRFQILHEYLQLLIIHLNQTVQIRYLNRNR